MDRTKPHGLLLKDNFSSKLFTIRQQSSPESVYANFLKGMRIHRDGSLAHAEGWENLNYPKNSLSGIGHIGNMLEILFRRLEAVETRLWFGVRVLCLIL